MAFNQKEQVQKRTGLRDSRELPSALLDWQPISERLAGESLLLCIDYDGTLTPIVKDPEEADLAPEMKRLLSELSSRVYLAIISGRDRATIQKFIQLRGIYYAGSHGLDISTPDGSTMQAPGSESYLEDLELAFAALKNKLNEVPGASIERKRYSITVHYRNVADNVLPLLEEVVKATAGETPGLRIESGKKIFEFKPRLDWDKGAALSWIKRQVSNGKEPFTIYLGDDVTDESAFEEIHRDDPGLAILVGDASYSTFARYKLDSVDQVQVFLNRILDTLN